MTKVKLSISVLCVVLVGNAAVAVQTKEAVPLRDPFEITDSGLRFAQSVVLADVSPSTVRRLTFYSDRAILALFDLANEDLAAAAGNATISEETTRAFSKSIIDLIEAGERSHLEIPQIAGFFEEEVATRFSGQLPIILQDINGEIDAKALFAAIQQQALAAKPKVDSSLLSALTLEGNATSLTADAAPNAEPVAAPVEKPVVVVEAAEGSPEEEINPAILAIRERATVANGKRVIEVVPGDTLAGLALAFFGETLRYRDIYQANESVLTNPNVLEVGQVLVIPN